MTSRRLLIALIALGLLSGCQLQKNVTNDKVGMRAMGENITIGELQLGKLRDLRRQQKFLDLPGTNTDLEQKRLSVVLDLLLDRLLAGVESNPNKAWVLDQFEKSLIEVQNEDTEARERFGSYLESIMDILQIESSDGLLSRYL